jgi:hypothetical protein
MTWIYLLVGLLVVGIVVIIILFAVKAPPFNKPYHFLDPRTWKPVENNQEWLIPDFNYGPYCRSEPSSDVMRWYIDLNSELGGQPIDYMGKCPGTSTSA